MMGDNINNNSSKELLLSSLNSFYNNHNIYKLTLKTNYDLWFGYKFLLTLELMGKFFLRKVATLCWGKPTQLHNCFFWSTDPIKILQHKFCATQIF